MTYIDMESPPNEIFVPSIDCMKDGHHVFLIGWNTQIFVTQMFNGEFQGEPFLH
jgi:hypothetical protein